MRPSRVDLYQIDRNPFGELLIAVPDLKTEQEAASFAMRGRDLVFYYEQGDVVRLPEIPSAMQPHLGHAQRLTLVEVDGDRMPLRCYSCEVSL